jgi:hypothetical protein
MCKILLVALGVEGPTRPPEAIRLFNGGNVMKKMLFGALSLAALVAGGIPAAFADPPTKITVPEDLIFFDQCSGEDVHFTGSTIFSFSSSANKNTFRFTLNIVERLDGVGLSTGASYKANVEDNFEETGSFSGFPFEHNEVVNMHLIGQGAVANETIKQNFHFTVNADGTITVDRASAEFTCHG